MIGRGNYAQSRGTAAGRFAAPVNSLAHTRLLTSWPKLSGPEVTEHNTLQLTQISLPSGPNVHLHASYCKIVDDRPLGDMLHDKH